MSSDSTLGTVDGGADSAAAARGHGADAEEARRSYCGRIADGRNHLPELRRREMTLGLPRRAAGSLRTTHILRSALGRTGYSIVMATEVGVMNASVSRSCSSGRYACQC